MRPIKFRAWDKEAKEMIPANRVDPGYSLMPNHHGGWHVPLQYTGLKDKNGKEIYEGDIVRLMTDFVGDLRKVPQPQEYIHTVEFVKGAFQLAHGLPFSNGFVEKGTVEVIGNIYENPDLLGEVR